MQGTHTGYSLYELLITTALVGTLLMAGVPGLSAVLARERQRTEVNALFHAVHAARKESIMRRRVVSLCPSVDGEHCGESDDWSTGWIMFENRDRDWPPQVDAGEPVLRRHYVADSVRIRANRRGFTLRAVFLRATNGTIVVCDAADRVAVRALVISYTGRPRIALRNRRGQPYACAD